MFDIMNSKIKSAFVAIIMCVISYFSSEIKTQRL